jgi:hypothetical protein
MRPRTKTSLLIVAGAVAITLVALIASQDTGRAAAGARLIEPPLVVDPTPPPPDDPRPKVVKTPAVDAPIGKDVPVGKRKIQIALLLDTSSSMSGLIDQARSQLWKVVNEFALAQQQNTRPRLEIALYQYGNDRLSPSRGWIQRVQHLTTDLDALSEKLFALSTFGGEEYVGQVIQAAADGLEWSRNPDDLKLIFVAGNEPFTQGPVPPAAAIALARRRGITVTPIHCGGDDPSWREGARLAGVSYMMIDHNRAVVHIPAPQDAEIARLAHKLNATYLGYGAQGGAAMARQEAQDKNAANVGQGALVQRGVARASSMYRNAAWDLVDGTRDGKVDLSKLRDEDLPAEMRKMTPAQRKAHVEAKAAERAGLQRRITQLNQEREQHVRAELAKRGTAVASTLDAMLIKTVRAQGSKNGWRFE